MASVSEQAPVRAPLRSTFATSIRLGLLRLTPLIGALVVEPWTAIGSAVHAAFRKLDREFQDSTLDQALENSPMRRHPHVLNAATNLLGICFIIIGGLKLTDQDSKTWSDEIAWSAAFFMIISILFSYGGIRAGNARPWQIRLADWSFLVGIAALILSMVIAAYQL
ncbi:MAG TPA: hypothetical protein VHW69_17180 [Rhizomicrobium sp.]|nr:hypothetical protein [Rhizomicrobium sp.]